jgi:hypothetical protein
MNDPLRQKASAGVTADAFAACQKVLSARD